MISYELSKKLEDAGYKPKSPLGWYINEAGYFGSGINEKNGVYCPTLPELIEACGSWRSVEQLPLRNINEGYIYKAMSWDGDSDEGSTPEEAVAHLWLELNKKTI